MKKTEKTENEHEKLKKKKNRKNIETWKKKKKKQIQNKKKKSRKKRKETKVCSNTLKFLAVFYGIKWLSSTTFPSTRQMGHLVRPWKPLCFFPCWVAAATSWIWLEGDWCSLLKRLMLWWQHFGCDSLPRANFGLTAAFHWASGRDDSVPVADHASTDNMFLCEETGMGTDGVWLSVVRCSRK